MGQGQHGSVNSRQLIMLTIADITSATSSVNRAPNVSSGQSPAGEALLQSTCVKGAKRGRVYAWQAGAVRQCGCHRSQLHRTPCGMLLGVPCRSCVGRTWPQVRVPKEHSQNFMDG